MTTTSATFPGTISRIHCSLNNQTKKQSRSTYRVNPSGFIYPQSNFQTFNANPTEFQTTKATKLVGGASVLDYIRITNTLRDNNSANYGKYILAEENSSTPIKLGKHLVTFDLEIESGNLGLSGQGPIYGFFLNARDTQPEDFNSPAVAPTHQIRIRDDGHHEHLVEVFNDGSAPGPSLFFSARANSKFTIKITNLEVRHIC